MPNDTTKELSPNKQALLRIRQLKQQLHELQSQQNGAFEPIAIVSMACRFPRNSRTPEDFWQCLTDGTDEVTEIPGDRWDLDAFYDEDPEVPGRMYARKGVFLDHLDLMDPEFFGISPREATWVDPQQRLMLEVGWEALERAGWTPKKIGDHTGVFVGWMHNDYQNESSDSFLNLNPYIATGAAGSFLCGRLAYYLGLQGPSVAVDTACSSSLVALHLACHSLQQRDCDRALVGGVNAICSPTTNILTCKLKALSPSGHSRAFDAAADGYLRGEGCGVVTLRRLSDARRDGDPILATIRGSAVGHNGFSSGLTAPNPKSQQKVIRQALQRAQIEPQDVSYLEAHGTGTELGDPIEMQAAAAALAADRSVEHPLLVGSVKTNIGHLEAAAGMAGLIKVLLAIQNDQIPGQLNFENPNPHIPWDKTAVKVLTETTPWPQSDRRIAGVSAFGMSGTNAHVIVEAVAASQHSTTTSVPGGAELIVISGKSEEAVQASAENLARELARESNVSLADVAYTTGCCREHFQQRAALVVRDHAQAVDELNTISRGGRSASAFIGSARKPPKIAWQFTGQGSQYVGMGAGLYDTEPRFRDTIEHCDQLLRGRRNESLIDVLFCDNDKIHHTSWTQPAIFAVQMGLATLLQSRGWVPDVVLGHSVGQYAAACVAGIMTWQDGLHLISERGRLIGELPPGGRMLAVFAPLSEISDELSNNDDVSLAALNGTHVVLSGPVSAVTQIEAQFEQRGIRCKSLTTSHAFHSKLMDPALQPFRQAASQIKFRPAQIPLIDNRTGALLDAESQMNADDWTQHIRQPVQFSESIKTVQHMGCDILLEIGPQSVLTRMASADWQQPADRLISCLHHDIDDSESFLKAIGQLYVHGSQPDFEAMYAGKNRQHVVLPTYPFQRRRFWGPDKPRAFHAEFHTAHPLLGGKVSLAGTENETRYEGFIETDSPPWLPDHEVMGQTVLPGAAYIEMALAASGTGQIRQVRFEQPLQPSSRTALQTILRTGEDQERSIETFSAPAGTSDWTRNFSAKIGQGEATKPAAIELSELQESIPETVEPSEFYRTMQEIGLNYGPQFQTVQSLNYSTEQVLAHLAVTGDVRGFGIPPTLLDGALHSLAAGLLRTDDDSLFLPIGASDIRCFQSAEQEVWCHAKWTKREGKVREADLVLFNNHGDVVVTIDGLQLQEVSRAALRQISGAGIQRLLHTLEWEPLRLPPSGVTDQNWLVVDCQGTAIPSAALAEKLVANGNRAVVVNLKPGAELTCQDDSTFTLCGESPADWDSLFDELSDSDSPFVPNGIAWFFGSGSEQNTASISGSLSPRTQADCTSLLSLIHVLQSRQSSALDCGLQLVTSDAIAVDSDGGCDPEQTQYWGIGRVIGAEQPELRCRLIDIHSAGSKSMDDLDAVVDILSTPTRDNQFAVRDAKCLVPRIVQLPIAKRHQGGFSTSPQGCYLITGGLGVLGLQAAKWLADHDAKQIVLVSRRSADESTKEFIDQLSVTGCDVVVHSADLSSRRDMEQLFARFGTDLNPLGGVIHAAGVLDDGLLGEQNWRRFEKVLSPKIIGASLLDEFTKELSLDFFILYSSASAVLGSPGQSNYATANAYLDGLAWRRRSQGLPAVSINWGPWSAGMADDPRIIKRLSLQGIVPLGVSEAHRALEAMLSEGATQTVVIDVDWRRLRVGLGSEPPAMLDRIAPVREKSQIGDSQLVSKLKQLRGNAPKELLVKTIQDLMQRVLNTPDLPETDRPLIEMGLDSLMAVEFSTELQMMLGEQFVIGPTMLFEHPSIDAISDHVLELIASDSDDSETMGQELSEQAAQGSVQGSRPNMREPIAIVGMSCRFPGAHDVDQFWQNILNGVDSVCEIPSDRWDIDRFYSDQRKPGKMYTRQGGFLPDVGDFDASFFNISDQEACWIDPQHRMLLENSYLALEDAGIRSHPLTDSNVGVFMGIMGQDYAFLPKLDDQEIIEAFQGAGLSHGAGVGRISYVFGFEGPSIAVDTASSSSLVAVYQAVKSLQDGNCNMALAGGVNAILAPVNSLLMSKAGLLSPDGRCKSFSEDADGFGRGEGCGVVVLKRLSDAQRDGDCVLATIRGGAVVHNGFTSGITSPSGKSQARAIGEALRDAGIAPSEVQYLEAHGTGTELGDPMELAAAASVYGKGRSPEQPLLVGSVKANISHLEAAGGISGLIKTVLCLNHGVIPRQIHFEKPSPHVPWNRLPIKVVTEQTDWPDAAERLAGVTALGLVGTNAHLVLGDAPAADDQAASTAAGNDELPTSTRSSCLLALSARTPDALVAFARRYHRYLDKCADDEFAAICRSASIGRRHFEHRIALTAGSCGDAMQQLATLIAEDSSIGNVQTSERMIKNGNGRVLPKSNGQTAVKPVAHGFVQGVVTTAPKIAWVFTGDQKSEFDFARDVYRVEPVFRATIDQFENCLYKQLGEEQTDTMKFGDWFRAQAADNGETIRTTDVHLFAIQAGLARLWQTWGIEPDAVAGFGVGQYTAACVAGGVAAEDALMLMVHRNTSRAELQRVVGAREHGSGDLGIADFVLDDTDPDQIAVLDRFEAAADAVNFYPPNLPLICSLSGQIVPVHRSLGGSYWRQHLTDEVKVAESLETFSQLEFDFLMELAPQPSEYSTELAALCTASASYLAPTDADRSAAVMLMNTIGRLYVGGANPNFANLTNNWSRRRVRLPHYPFQKSRYWITEVGRYREPKQTTSS